MSLIGIKMRKYVENYKEQNKSKPKHSYKSLLLRDTTHEGLVTLANHYAIPLNKTVEMLVEIQLQELTNEEN